MAVFELMARADGEVAPFNVEKVFSSLMTAIEQVGLSAVPEWNALWRSALTKSLKWKAAGEVERSALDEVMEMLGAFSLAEATTQQIRSVYSSCSVFVASMLEDEEPPQQLQAELSVSDMDAEEFKRYDVFELSQVDKPQSDRQCISCATPYKYGSDFCDTCRQYKKNT
jgi:hypothetical protein